MLRNILGKKLEKAGLSEYNKDLVGDDLSQALAHVHKLLGMMGSDNPLKGDIMVAEMHLQKAYQTLKYFAVAKEQANNESRGNSKN